MSATNYQISVTHGDFNCSECGKIFHTENYSELEITYTCAKNPNYSHQHKIKNAVFDNQNCARQWFKKNKNNVIFVVELNGHEACLPVENNRITSCTECDGSGDLNCSHGLKQYHSYCEHEETKKHD